MMKNLKLAKKIFVLSGVIIFAFTLAIAALYSTAKDSLYEGKREEVKHSVEASWSIVQHFVKQAESGELTVEEAQSRAREAVRDARYDGDNYFWINDLSPRMVMHPFKPELEGQDVSRVADPTGKALFVEIASVAKAEGEGFISYQWSKPGFSKPVDKVSYAKLVPEWGWVVGSGLYLDEIQDVLNKLLYMALGVVLTVILVSVVLVLFVARSISRPMGQIVQMLAAMERGHLDRRMGLDQKDEIGQLAKAMDGFADNLQNEMVVALKKLAAGDLTFEARPRDEQDAIRGALKTVGDDLNTLMSQINMAGTQIAAGAGQVSDSSQSLSQGSTESASSLEEITSSMTEMGSQTRQNAENASQANRLAVQARDAAENGNGQMLEMIGAMEDISEAGQSISKIIKVIDEIAFQTNLLALNAAVEAARAGQHGKGFAVVAEEVRNLAARSAKAAQETSELIESSVDKTNRGTEIAGKTGQALEEIVSSVTKVTDLVAEIAAASEEQAQGLAQVNQGLEQIDQVTQQNTANAEESAAAAEELAGQSAQLKQMLGRFALREGRAAAAPMSPEGIGEIAPQATRPARTKGTWGPHTHQPAPAEVIDLDDAEFGRY